ncbi:hypothetical protein GALMADRAFT_135025 [Galerina marginata CBS 339.88]|uniref:Uncharacterized protein n=1 Tax=Galerina marginata (strain CBS 339.88) TaxID=685588 RepID=A0A067TGX6_GALM3|nr:hypothetical protein GALMADRAFT_135025 [Galerina marginata CBS 339.88]
MLFAATHSVLTDHAVLATHPPPYVPGPYVHAAAPVAARVPSLVALCIRALLPFPDQLHQLPVRLPLRVPSLLDDLVPDPALLDPRLWASLVQIFDRLPSSFASHSLPLADIHLPLLQSIPSTVLFSLVTILSLPACVHLTDDTVLQLRFLHALTAFDASSTSLSSYAIKTLAATLQLDDPDDGSNPRGPWQIRVISLRNCKKLTNDAFPHLVKFPLLSVIDLRGTRCLPDASIPFKPCSNGDLYHPAPVATALSTLYDLQPDLFSSSNPYILNINTLTHRPTKPLFRAPVAPQDAFVVIPANHSRIKVGNIHVLEKHIKEEEAALAHDKNKAAWYERQERIESRMDIYDSEDEDGRPHVEFRLKSFISSSTDHKPRRRVLQSKDTTPLRYDPSKGVSRPKPDYRASFPLPPPHRRPTVFGTRSTRLDNISPAPYQHPTQTVMSVSRLPINDRALPNNIGPSNPSTPPQGLGGPETLTLLQDPHPRVDADGDHRRGATVGNTGPAELQNAGSGMPPNSLPQTRTTTPEIGAQARSNVLISGEQVNASRTGTAAPTLLTSTSVASTDQFYGSFPRATQRHKRESTTSTSSSLLLRGPRRVSESLERANDLGVQALDDLDRNLRLYRHPPPWSALSEALVHLRSEEARSRQCRTWNRLSTASAIAREGEGGGAMAVVDMTSEKAARAKRELERVMEEANARARKVRKVLPEEGADEIEEGDEERGRYGRYKRSAAFGSKMPASSSSPISTSVLQPIQPPMVAEPTSRNPFRRHLAASDSISTSPLATTIATKSPEIANSTVLLKPLSAKPRSNVGTGVVATSLPKTNAKLAPTPTPIPKPMIPISAVKVPVLPPEMQKEALKRERKETLSAGPVKRKKSISMENRRLSGPTSGTSNSKASKGGGKFDWKTWGKTK